MSQKQTFFLWQWEANIFCQVLSSETFVPVANIQFFSRANGIKHQPAKAGYKHFCKQKSSTFLAHIYQMTGPLWNVHRWYIWHSSYWGSVPWKFGLSHQISSYNSNALTHNRFGEEVPSSNGNLQWRSVRQVHDVPGRRHWDMARQGTSHHWKARLVLIHKVKFTTQIIHNYQP